jgi:hypothetical protein
LLVADVLAGFTTFSGFSMKTGSLWERARWVAVAYVTASVLGGLAPFWGLLLGSEARVRLKKFLRFKESFGLNFKCLYMYWIADAFFR